MKSSCRSAWFVLTSDTDQPDDPGGFPPLPILYMSDPIVRRRVRQGTAPAPANAARVVLRRRRCEPAPASARSRRGSGWRQGTLVVLTLLAAGPVWALGGAIAARYHEELAVLMEHTRAHFDWSGVRAPEVATTGPVPQAANTVTGHGGGGSFAGTPASSWDGPSNARNISSAAVRPINPNASRVASAPSPASRPAGFSGAGPMTFARLAPEGVRQASHPVTRAVVATNLYVDTTDPKQTNETYAGTTYTVPAAGVSYGTVYDGYNGFGTINHTSGILTASQGVVLGANAGSSGTYNLNGGTLSTPSVGSSGMGASKSMFNFNGGTLQAALDTTTFVSGLTSANVRDGGAIIDTANFNVAVPVPLVHSTITGDAATDGGLTKEGTGTLTLTANNTFNGTTVVTAGALLVNNVPAKAGDSGTGSGTVFVGPGGTLGGTGQIGGNVAVGTTGSFSPAPLAVLRPQALSPSAVLAPGVNGVGTLTILGGLTLDSNATVAITLGNTPTANEVLAGSVLLAGSLELTLGTGVKPTLGEQFFIVGLLATGVQVDGTFENAGANGTFVDDQGNTYSINYNDNQYPGVLPNDVLLTVVSLVPEPGTWIMLGLGGALMMMAVWARRRAGNAA